MKTFIDIINLWPSAEIFSDDLRLKHRSHGRIMKMRNSIPEKYWPRVAEAAARRGISGATTDDLSRALVGKKSVCVQSGDAA